jgi:hypothetical protein
LTGDFRGLSGKSKRHIARKFPRVFRHALGFCLQGGDFLHFTKCNIIKPSGISRGGIP